MSEPGDEPLRTTLLRTGTIAALVGLGLAVARGGLAWWPTTTLLALWPAFGGHWVELGFLRWLRPRLPAARGAQVCARVVVWLVGGVLLAVGATLTAAALDLTPWYRPAAWALGGPIFVGIELVAHLALWLLGRPSVYDGRG